MEVNIPISPRCSRAQVWRRARAIVDHLLHLGGIYSAVVGTHTHGKLVEEYEYVYIYTTVSTSSLPKHITYTFHPPAKRTRTQVHEQEQEQEQTKPKWRNYATAVEGLW